MTLPLVEAKIAQREEPVLDRADIAGGRRVPVHDRVLLVVLLAGDCATPAPPLSRDGVAFSFGGARFALHRRADRPQPRSREHDAPLLLILPSLLPIAACADAPPPPRCPRRVTIGFPPGAVVNVIRIDAVDPCRCAPPSWSRRTAPRPRPAGSRSTPTPRTIPGETRSAIHGAAHARRQRPGASQRAIRAGPTQQRPAAADGIDRRDHAARPGCLSPRLAELRSAELCAPADNQADMREIAAPEPPPAS